MKQIIIDEVKSLYYSGKIDYRIKYHFKGSRMVGEYRINSGRELTQEEMIRKIQLELYGVNYGVDYSSEKDFTVVVKFDKEQFDKEVFNVKEETNKDITSIKLKDNDIVIIRTDIRLSVEKKREVEKTWSKIFQERGFNNIKVIALSGGVNVEVISRE